MFKIYMQAQLILLDFEQINVVIFANLDAVTAQFQALSLFYLNRTYSSLVKMDGVISLYPGIIYVLFSSSVIISFTYAISFSFCYNSLEKSGSTISSIIS